MLLGPKEEISDKIIYLLAKGEFDAMDLQKKIQDQASVTKQGFYKALRRLISHEIVVKNKHRIILNNAWVNRISNFAATIDQNYQDQASESFLNLRDGESIAYYFKSIPHLDVLWKHYFLIIMKHTPGEDIVLYNSHEFWSLFRHNTKRFLYEWISNHGRTAYEIIGHNTPLDRSTTLHIKKYGISMMYEPAPSMPSHVFPAAIGDYIIDTILDKATIRAIDALYLKYETTCPELMEDLNEILSSIKHSKIVISKNKSRAEAIRKKLVRKYFTF